MTPPLSIGELVLWSNGKVSVMTEDGLVPTPAIDWRVAWAVENARTWDETPNE